MKVILVNTTPHQIIFCPYYSRLSQPLNLRTLAKWARITRGGWEGFASEACKKNWSPPYYPVKSSVFVLASSSLACELTLTEPVLKIFEFRPADWPFFWPISVSGRNVVRVNLLFLVHNVGGTTPFEKAEQILSVKEADNLTSTPCTTSEGWKKKKEKRDSTQ